MWLGPPQASSRLAAFAPDNPNAKPHNTSSAAPTGRPKCNRMFSPHLQEALGFCALLVLPMRHQILYHGRIRQGRSIAEAARFVLGDLAQDAAHDLAGAGLRQP